VMHDGSDSDAAAAAMQLAATGSWLLPGCR
jgi:hypothetical protein